MLDGDCLQVFDPILKWYVSQHARAGSNDGLYCVG